MLKTASPCGNINRIKPLVLHTNMYGELVDGIQIPQSCTDLYVFSQTVKPIFFTVLFVGATDSVGN